MLSEMTYDRAMQALASAVMDKKITPFQIRKMGDVIKANFNVDNINLAPYLPKWTQEVSTGGFSAGSDIVTERNKATEALARELRNSVRY